MMSELLNFTPLKTKADYRKLSQEELNVAVAVEQWLEMGK